MAVKQLPVDFLEFIRLLNARNVEYVLVGGWAVGIYAEPRATADIDFYISNSQKNIQRVVDALADFGLHDVPADLLLPPNDVLRIGRSPLLIEIITHADGLEFATTFERRETIEIEGTEVSVISIDQLLINKRASGRAKDLADIESLEKFR